MSSEKTASAVEVPPARVRQAAPTIRQVAALAGVSRATASRAINGGHLVSDQARAAVEAAVASLGFVPNPVARSLATRRTGSVALVIPEPNTRVLTDPFFASAINGMARAVEESDLQLVLLIARRDGWSTRTSRYLTTGHVDGAVIASHHRDDTLNRTLVESGLPVVFIGRPLDVPPSARYVDTDNAHAAQLATEHLITRGHRRIGTVAGPADMSAAIDRLAGWNAAMDAAGLRADAVVHGDFTAAGGATAMARLLDEHPDLDAVFVATDLMASGALGELATRGIRVPDDLAIFGFDDLGVAETTDPPLSTMGQPIEDMATRAGEILRDLITGVDVPENPVTFPARLILRDSA
ncbi:LacI family DNA-binding transcriptional regulator [Actinotalea sp. K2]|uniref:LacI family DNA-binding transcriptional regulator n=1 Tax=Actinotalea sp. K2 TaxID=2939438 RepID=UPI002017F827|nr:LacI family DNA-binding transcriptional regulator [Actinotalea sp. K2]MCL3862929.1 LacI family transcriptional regulator [Actinotalea sp. K2]